MIVWWFLKGLVYISITGPENGFLDRAYKADNYVRDELKCLKNPILPFNQN